MDQLETDVVVVAAGAAGIAASCAAAQLGMKVHTFEKGATTGGAASMGMGPLGIESRLTRAKQLAPSRDEAFSIFMNYVHWQADAKLVRTYLNKSGNTIDWLESMGVEFVDAASYFPGAFPTWHLVKPESGLPGPTAAAAMVKILTERAKEMGVHLHLQAPVTRLIKEGDKVVGVVAEDRSGEQIEVKAKAVIIATGGFGDNPKMIKKYTGYEWGKDIYSFRVPGMEGDGLRMAWEAGAQATPMRIELICAPPAINEIGWSWGSVIGQPHLVVNLLGERFINEAEGNSSFRGNAFALQKDRTGFLLFDDSIKNGMKTYLDYVNMINPIPCVPDLDELIEKALASNYQYFFMGSSVEELASQTGIASAGLQTTITQYNDFCNHGYDEWFAKPKRYLRPIRTGPFYAIQMFPSGYGTLGGIKINYKTEVLDKNWNSIPGLYAARTDACDIYGDTYVFLLPGNTMGFALNSGRMAAENAAAYVRSIEAAK